MQAAMALQQSMNANFGGTEILRPLEHVYKEMQLIPGHPRQVFCKQ
jgi:hypothetical protein